LQPRQRVIIAEVAVATAAPPPVTPVATAAAWSASPGNVVPIKSAAVEEGVAEVLSPLSGDSQNDGRGSDSGDSSPGGDGIPRTSSSVYCAGGWLRQLQTLATEGRMEAEVATTADMQGGRRWRERMERVTPDPSAESRTWALLFLWWSMELRSNLSRTSILRGS
jgi:hypothetical protein